MCALAFMVACVKMASDMGVHLVQILFVRSIFSLALIAIWVMITKRGLSSLAPISWRLQLIRAVVGLVAISLGFSAIIQLPIAEATALIFMSPLFAVLLARLILAESVNPRQISATCFGLVGVVILVNPGSGYLPLPGVILALFASLAAGVVVVALRHVGKSEGVAATTFWFMVATALVSGFLLPFVYQPVIGKAWFVLFIAAVAASVGQALNMLSLRLAPVSLLSVIDYSQVIWAALFGLLIWDVFPPASTWLGATVIAASSIWLVRSREY